MKIYSLNGILVSLVLEKAFLGVTPKPITVKGRVLTVLTQPARTLLCSKIPPST